MKHKMITIAAIALLGLPSMAGADEPALRDVCPNIEGSQNSVPEGHELKWSNRYGAYICVEQRN